MFTDRAKVFELSIFVRLDKLDVSQKKKLHDNYVKFVDVIQTTLPLYAVSFHE